MNRRNSLTLCFALAGFGLSSKLIAQTAAQMGSKPKPKAGAKPTNTELLDLINQGGRQRMLSQRMAKVYAQLGLGILPERATSILNSSISLFDSQLITLLELSPTPEIKKNYAVLDQAWRRYKSILQAAPNPVNGQNIYRLSDELTALANTAVESLDNFVGSNTGALVNLSGRQRMLTQRLAKKVFFREWLGLKDNVLQIEKDTAEYEKASANLALDKETTERVKTDLNLAKTQWLFFQDAIQASLKSKSNKIHLTNVANTSERMLEMYDSVTKQFATQVPIKS
jgi:hypothetical protein